VSQGDYEEELTADREEIASVLSGVADGIRTGAIRLGDNTDAVTVETPDELTLEIELETEDGEMSLELELRWAVSGEATPVSSLDITPENEDEEIPLAGSR